MDADGPCPRLFVVWPRGIPRAMQKEDAMDWKIELIFVPVTDVDRAKEFLSLIHI